MSLFNILSCNGSLGSCCNDAALLYSLNALRRIIGMIQIVVPIILMIATAINFFNLLMNPEDKDKKLLNTLNMIFLVK